MALTKETVEDKIEVVDCGGWKMVQVRTATVIKDDGVEISRTFHREVLNPNNDVSGESDEVKKLAEIYFTDDAKAKHKAAMESGGPG